MEWLSAPAVLQPKPLGFQGLRVVVGRLIPLAPIQSSWFFSRIGWVFRSLAIQIEPLFSPSIYLFYSHSL